MWEKIFCRRENAGSQSDRKTLFCGLLDNIRSVASDCNGNLPGKKEKLSTTVKKTHVCGGSVNGGGAITAPGQRQLLHAPGKKKFCGPNSGGRNETI